MNALDLRTALDRDADLVGEPSPDLLDQLVSRRRRQRRQRAGILATAAAVVLIGGGIPVVSSLTMTADVAPATQPTTASAPPATTEAAPTTSADPAPSSSADPTPAPASTSPEPAALVLGPDGLGSLELGMSLGEAEATGMLEPRAGDWPPGTECRPQFRLSDDPAGTSVVWYSDALGLAAIQVGEGVLTPEGIGIGSSLADVERAYPGWPHYDSVMRGEAPVTGRADKVYRIAYSQDGVVTELTLQHAMNGCYE
jgi:hypothetical protein